MVQKTGQLRTRMKSRGQEEAAPVRVEWRALNSQGRLIHCPFVAAKAKPEFVVSGHLI